MKKILVTGAAGQIGSELTPALRNLYGEANVIAAGYNKQLHNEMTQAGPFCRLDVRDKI
jgi:nucleoside-diphosphate-sugar epimerase